MRFGYWMPVFGGWLRNIPDEGMEASWTYVKRLTQRSEETGWDLSLKNPKKGYPHLTGTLR